MSVLMRGTGQRTSQPVLQSAPDDDEKYSYLDRSLPYVFCALVICAGCTITAQVIMEIYHPALWPIGIYTLAYTLYQVISIPVNFTGRGFDFNKHQRLIADWIPRTWPTVDIYLPVCNEPIEVIKNTWVHVAKLLQNCPAEAVQVWVLDDGNDPHVRQLAGEFPFHYVRRPNHPADKKSGNLRYAFSITSGEFFVVLDADFAPRPDFLHETLPYFDDDPDLGIVQTPQFFRVNSSQTWIEQAAGAVQEVFYRLIQVSRDRIGASICVGTCAVYRRETFAAQGGTTLIAYAEDVHTGLDARRDGWDLRYIPIVLTTGVCPDNVDAFIRQQYRWCNGSTSTLLTSRLWTVPMSIWARLTYISGAGYYLTTALAVFLLPLAPILLLLFAPGTINPADAGLLLVAAFTGLTAFPYWHNNRYSLRATIPLSLLRGWAHTLAIYDFFRKSIMAWETSGSNVRSVDRFWRGIKWWNGGSAVVWLVLAVWRATQANPARFSIIIAAAVVNLLVVTVILNSRKTSS